MEGQGRPGIGFERILVTVFEGRLPGPYGEMVRLFRFQDKRSVIPREFPEFRPSRPYLLVLGPYFVGFIMETRQSCRKFPGKFQGKALKLA